MSSSFARLALVSAPPSSSRPLALLLPSCRSISVTPPSFSAAPPPPPAASAVPSTVGSFKPSRPVGGFRGGLVGFLLGFTVASAYASYHLLDEYKHATDLLLESVRELEGSTAKMSDHVRRIEEVEGKVKQMREDGAGKEDVKKLRQETKKVYDSLRLEFLDVKSHVWGLEQDLGIVTKKNTYQIV
ncbi:hypothetical protein BDY24DRAFT_411205 [Mrakia frigida]|uniref:uncharacterized protein n=1 Tax=Mrakia frigida TaxID=29902 RepID=UPI003FCC0182